MKSIYLAEVVVMPKTEVADPQGQAIEMSVARLNLRGNQGIGDPGIRASNIRVGKVFRLTLEAEDRAGAETALRLLADKVLANPNIESFSCSLLDEKH